GVLGALKVDALICGGIGGGAQMALSDAGIRIYGGVSGNADAAAEALAAGELDFSHNVQCDHHGHHEEGHSCGSHGCGHHSCD
ncbi:MAG: NifB/NifX family molybdenum-iron cluster-binding protein, partial [Solobacterium sp.]|nr:NifB/NifX family molybdenum-iron cluster-binding protein [Solobacterium sp.]